MAVFWKPFHCSLIELNLSPWAKCPPCGDWLAYLSSPNMLYIPLPEMCLFKLSLYPICLSELFSLSHSPLSLNMEIKSLSHLHEAFSDRLANRAIPSTCYCTSFSKPFYETSFVFLSLLAFSFFKLSNCILFLYLSYFTNNLVDFVWFLFLI